MLRVLSSVILAPLALVIAYVGGPLFVMFWTLAAVAVLWEWVSLTAPADRTPVFAAGSIAIVAAAVLLALGRPGVAVMLPAFGVIAAALLARSGSRVWCAAGVAYAAAAMLAPVLLRRDAAWGFAAVMLIFAAVWLTDVAAYFCGRAIGGPKLMPRVSPNKTWSGAVGGTIAAVGGGVLVAWLSASPTVGTVAALCFVLSIVSQIGDLGESHLKRLVGAKDSGQLIPGHGGVMDRLDGFIVAALAACLIGVARGGLDRAATGLMVW